MPCLFALFAAFTPRLALLFLWLFTPMVNSVFHGAWLWPLLGIIFLPFTTLMYVLVVAPLGPTNIWGWFAVLMGLLIDLRNVFDAYANRSEIDRYRTQMAYRGAILNATPTRAGARPFTPGQATPVPADMAR